MRSFLLSTCVAFATYVPLSTHAQVSCQHINGFTYCSNGLQSQQLGNIEYFNNGMTRQRLGSFDYYSPPPVMPQYQPPPQTYQQPPVYQPRRSW